MCYAEFLRCYYLTQSRINENDYETERLTDPLILEIYPFQHIHPNLIPLMSGKEKLKSRNIPHALQYYEPNSRRPHTYSQTFNKPEVNAVVNQNKRLIKPHARISSRSILENAKH